MSDQLDTAILKAGLDLLTADSVLNTQDGFVPNGTARPYVLVQGWVDRPDAADSDALDGLSRTITARWYLHCVGDTRESASVMQERARFQMLDKQLALGAFPTVAFTLIKQESALQPSLDETTGVPVFDAISVYKVRATL